MPLSFIQHQKYQAVPAPTYPHHIWSQQTQGVSGHPTADGAPLATWSCHHSIQVTYAGLLTTSWIGSLIGGHIEDLLCSTHEHHQTKPPANVLNRGTTCWPLSEQERPPDLCQNSLQRALALLTAFLILFLSLLSSSLLFITLLTHFCS